MDEAERALEQYATGAELEGLARLMRWGGWQEFERGTPHGTLVIRLEAETREGVRCRRLNGSR